MSNELDDSFGDEWMAEVSAKADAMWAEIKAESKFLTLYRELNRTRADVTLRFPLFEGEVDRLLIELSEMPDSDDG